MSAHRPATPLPWEQNKHEPQLVIAFGSVFGDAAECREEGDAAYIVHACNSYPNLVAALRLELIEIDNTMATGSRDIQDWQDDNRSAADRIREILRELGEAE